MKKYLQLGKKVLAVLVAAFLLVTVVPQMSTYAYDQTECTCDNVGQRDDPPPIGGGGVPNYY